MLFSSDGQLVVFFTQVTSGISKSDSHILTASEHDRILCSLNTNQTSYISPPSL